LLSYHSSSSSVNNKIKFHHKCEYVFCIHIHVVVTPIIYMQLHAVNFLDKHYPLLAWNLGDCLSMSEQFSR
jgi:hypothetical protein